MSREVQRTNRSIADRDVPTAIVAIHTPDIRQRLLVPPARLVERETEDQHKKRDGLMTTPESDRLERPKLNPLKRAGHYIAAFFKLGRTEWMAKQALRSTEQFRPSLEMALISSGQALGLSEKAEKASGYALESLEEDRRSILSERQHVENILRNHETRFDVLKEDVEIYDSVAARAITDLGRRLDLMLVHRFLAQSPYDSAQAPRAMASRDSEGFRAFCDQFYHRLENRYRGSEAVIANRLRVYLPDVEAAAARCSGKPVLDIGCGRGEWLGLLKRAGVSAFGVDSNAMQIDEGQREGLDVRLGDAIAFLTEAEPNSLSVITAHHLVEHLPFETVAWIVREAARVLAPGGLLLFETPDVRNVLVGATTFHSDPTHLKPMSEQVLGVLFETAGYHPVDIRHLNPHERLNEFLARPNFDDELAMLLFGPQDLAVLGVKPNRE